MSSSTLSNCLFEDNAADSNGGGLLRNFLSNPELDNCVFRGNSASDDGGGMYSNPTRTPSLVDTILCGNTPEQVYGMFGDRGGNCIQEFCVDCRRSNCPTDLDGDDLTNGADLGLFFVAWGSCEGCAEDFKSNGEVNGEDLGLLFAAWGACP